MISPVLERLTSDVEVKTGSGSALDLVTVDTDAQTSLAQEYRVIRKATFHIIQISDILQRFLPSQQ